MRIGLLTAGSRGLFTMARRPLDPGGNDGDWRPGAWASMANVRLNGRRAVAGCGTGLVCCKNARATLGRKRPRFNGLSGPSIPPPIATALGAHYATPGPRQNPLGFCARIKGRAAQVGVS